MCARHLLSHPLGQRAFSWPLTLGLKQHFLQPEPCERDLVSLSNSLTNFSSFLCCLASSSFRFRSARWIALSSIATETEDIRLSVNDYQIAEVWWTRRTSLYCQGPQTWQCQPKGTCFLLPLTASTVMNKEPVNIYEMTEDYPNWIHSTLLGWQSQPWGSVMKEAVFRGFTLPSLINCWGSGHLV